MTVFLTTQYLEEADVLADRVGIIDHGHIVAEGTPTELKAEIGRPTVEVVPADPEQRDRVADILRRFGELVQLSPDSVAVRCAHGELDLAEIIRALDAENLHVANLQLHAPSSTTSSSRRPAGRSRAPRPRPHEADAEAEPERRPHVSDTWAQIYYLARRSVVRQSRQPANVDRADDLPARPARRERRRPPGRDDRSPASRPTASSPSRSRCRSCRARCSRR